MDRQKDCECDSCKHVINEYFCIGCGYNFNECESFHKIEGGVVLCPKCHPEGWIYKKREDEYMKKLAEDWTQWKVII